MGNPDLSEKIKIKHQTPAPLLRGTKGVFGHLAFDWCNNALFKLIDQNSWVSSVPLSRDFEMIRLRA